MAARRTTRDAVLGAIDGLYAAASGNIGWDAALGRLALPFGFPAAVMQLFDNDFRVLSRVWHGFADETQAEYIAHYRHVDPLLKMILERPRHTLLYTALHTPEAELDRSEYYTWKERRQGLVHHLGMRTGPRTPFLGVMTMHRPRSAGHAEPADIALFSRLAPHLERALALEHSLGTATLRAAAAEDVLDARSIGVVMLDRRGAVVYANRMARAMAASADAFALGRDRIRALRRDDDAVLQRLVGDAARAGDDVYAARGGAMRLSRRSGQRGYDVTVAPLTPRGGLFDKTLPALCITIADPAALPGNPCTSLLWELYRVTPAELRVAERLAAGDAPKRIAETLSISIATVREHLRALYRRPGRRARRTWSACSCCCRSRTTLTRSAVDGSRSRPAVDRHRGRARRESLRAMPVSGHALIFSTCAAIATGNFATPKVLIVF